MEHDFLPSPKRRWLRDAALAGIAACLLLVFFTSSAGAQSAPAPAPDPTSPATSTATPSDAPAADETIPSDSSGDAPAVPSTFIDPARLEALQSSVVGLVIVWEEPADPWAGFRLESPSEPAATAVSLCTGWFNTATTIVTAGHCVDPAEGRLLLDEQAVTIDPVTRQIVVPPPGRPEPRRTVYAFQPRELPGAVITAPTISESMISGKPPTVTRPNLRSLGSQPAARSRSPRPRRDSARPSPPSDFPG